MSHDLNDLRFFTMVAQAGGYAAAARKYGIARATLSRRVAALEEALGQRLIERSSRSFHLTDAGEALFARAREAISQAEAAFACLPGGETALRGRLRLAAPPSLLALGFYRLLVEFLQRHSGIELHIAATNRRVDLRAEGIDLALRVGDPSLAAPDLVVVPFCQIDHVFVHAPSLSLPENRPVSAMLETIPSLAWGPPDQAITWDLEGEGKRRETVALTPRLQVQDMAMLRQAALAGLGLAMMPRFLVAEDLAEGRLVEKSFALSAPTLRIHAVHLGVKHMRPALRVLLDDLKQAARHLR